jgi:O-antigen/teichoic acid export membrane protein
MSLGKKIFQGGVKIGLGQVFSQGCSFLRNVIVARLITPADFGIAATFAMTLSLVEMASNLAAEKLLVQSRHGDEERFLGTVHCVQAIRGVFNGVVLFCVAGVVAPLFGVPEATWAFRWLSLFPVFRGLIHQDINRFQRNMRFGPSISVEALSIGIMTLLAYPLGVRLGDYSCMLWIILGQSALAALLSHRFAERRYRWAWDKIFAREMLLFGWPWLINGFLMFGIFQGDRFVIASADRLFHKGIYSLEDLGVYSVAFALTFAPTNLIAGISTSLFLPLLSNIRSEEDIFFRRYKFICEAIALAGGVFAIFLIGSGEWIVKVFFGEKYSLNAAALVAWLAAMQSLRIMRIGPTLAAMSRGDTKNAMYSNMARSLSFIAVLASAATGKSIVWIAASGFVGELLAIGLCTWRLREVHGVRMISCLGPVSLALSFMGIGAAVLYTTNVYTSMVASLMISGVTVILFIVSGMSSFKVLRQDIVSFRTGL